MVSNIFHFHPYLGKISNLTDICFKWVETTNQLVCKNYKDTLVTGHPRCIIHCGWHQWAAWRGREGDSASARVETKEPPPRNRRKIYALLPTWPSFRHLHNLICPRVIVAQTWSWNESLVGLKPPQKPPGGLLLTLGTSKAHRNRHVMSMTGW